MAGEAIGGAALGIVGGVINGALQQHYNRQNMELQHQYNEESANNADKRTRALYSDLYSPQAQMAMLKEAGLSPSLMYSNGQSGGGGQSGAQGAGTGLPGVGMDLAGNMSQAMQVANTIKLQNAQIEKLKAETEGQEQDNANDPVIAEYKSIEQETINHANEIESDQVNKAYSKLLESMVNIGYFSENVSISKSESKGSSKSTSTGWSFDISDQSGKSHSYTIGSSKSNAEGHSNNFGGGGNGFSSGSSKNNAESKSSTKSESNASNAGHSQGESHQNAESWSKQVANAIAEASGKSGNKTELEAILKTFYDETKQAINYGDKTRENATTAFQWKCERYEKNRSKKKK